MNDYIDDYCERLAPGLWAEPLNAVTNLAFLLSALTVWRLARREQQTTPGILLLILLLVAIAIGSGLFHTIANRWSQLTDVIPIAVFQIVFLWLYLRRIAQLHWGYAGGILLLFFVSGWLAGKFPHLLNGSLGYAPALLFVTGLALYHKQHARRESNVLLYAVGMFCLALTCRTLDQTICPILPIGTHFLWHLCNAGVLYLSMRGLITNYARVT